MEDDDDAFLYGSEGPVIVQQPSAPPYALTSGASLLEDAKSVTTKPAIERGVVYGLSDVPKDQVVETVEEEEEEEEEDSESDVEIIMDSETPNRSRDFRTNIPHRGPPPRMQPPAAARPLPDFTTEYTPRERGTPLSQSMPEVSASFQPVPTDGEARTSSALDRPSSSLGGEAFPQAEPSSDPTYPDPSTLPPAYAAAFAPKINPTEAGTFSGMAIYDTDIQALAEKNWRRPGADVTDWFNYGFDEISWEAYCVRRRDMAALAAELKANVLNMAGMPEEMLQNSVPPEMRSMLIAQSARMNIPQQQMGFPNGTSQGAGFPMQSMFPGMNMTPDMMGMGMAPHMGGAFGPGNASMAGAMGAFPSGLDGNGVSIPNGMGAGMSGPSGMMQQQHQTLSQQPQMQQIQQQVGQGMPLAGELMPASEPLENNATPEEERSSGQQPSTIQTFSSEPSAPTAPLTRAPPMRGAYRGGVRGGPPRPFGGGVPLGPTGPRVPQVLPKRPASPLPPNVPTGPRNQQPRYKDKDRDGGTTSQVDGLDYGGGSGSIAGSGSAGGDDLDRDKERSRDRDRDRERSTRDRERERDRERDRERERGAERDERERRRDKSPPSAPRKDKEKEERERKKREEKEKERRGVRDIKDDRLNRKRGHSEDHEEDPGERRSKRR